MRWIFFSLLLVNALLLGWYLLQDDTTPVAAPASAPVEPVGDHVPPLTLLAELEGERLSKLRRQAGDRLQAVTDSPLGSAEEPICTLVGPYARLLTAEYLVERLAALEIVAKVQEVEIPGDAGFWVYLAPEVSKKQALRRLHELQAKGVDSYVIPKGDLANGISFGMFSQPKLAQKRQADMIAQGYDALLYEFTRSHKETWVLFQPEEARKVGQELWQQLLNDAPELERRQNFCSGVASK